MRKQTRGRWGKIVVAVSGGWDPIHVGHVRLFNAAKKLGDKLVVILNNDNWLIAKKGFVFMAEQDRKEILESLSAVDKVVLTSHRENDPDQSVCRELRKLRPHIFANGGDRTTADAKKKTSSLNGEVALCEELGIKTIFNIGRGGKMRSSTELVARFEKGRERAIPRVTIRA